ncbi:flagellar export chaperone FliS [Terriglobus roseus]|uniref:Flagellar protein FliS n=1 Tax=Terriglobus roseus TaxID=392734 RepID=A0A1G7KCT8_9BACT|nr:flagellar export chaperone FliS [Terriglobus roseus]SDF34881.1 flagellar protein FliS [Terriglobus roseus]
MNYQEQALSGATGVELIVALYDGWIRFLYRAAAACDADDVIERRYAVKRALDILMYLEARLRPDIGGEPAKALSDFYAAMFTMTLEASHSGSSEEMQKVIACVRNVKEAWVVVAKDPAANRALPRELRTSAERRGVPVVVPQHPTAGLSIGWSA